MNDSADKFRHHLVTVPPKETFPTEPGANPDSDFATAGQPEHVLGLGQSENRSQMGGGEIFDMLKLICPNVKVLLCSGYSLDGRASEIMNRGCAGFIQKPFNLREISRKIREVLDT